MARPQPFLYDVFLSHSSADKPVVRELAARLRDAGLRVWLDEWIIQPGDLISQQIEQGLEQSALLLFCMSENAFGSDWAQLESHTAIFRDPLNRDRRFVTLRLDDAPIKAMLRGYAYIDWRAEQHRERELRRLLEVCRPGAAEVLEPSVEPQKRPERAPEVDERVGQSKRSGSGPAPMKVFLSSTAQDLSAFRQVADDTILRLSQQAVVMERFGPLPGEPVAECERKARESDVVVCVVEIGRAHV